MTSNRFLEIRIATWEVGLYATQFWNCCIGKYSLKSKENIHYKTVKNLRRKPSSLCYPHNCSSHSDTHKHREIQSVTNYHSGTQIYVPQREIISKTKQRWKDEAVVRICYCVVSPQFSKNVDHLILKFMNLQVPELSLICRKTWILAWGDMKITEQSNTKLHRR